MDDQNKLYRIRLAFKTEMQRAITAKTPKQKRMLVDEWKRKYSTVTYEEMLRLARNKTARLKVAEWNLDDFDNEKRKPWTST